MRHSLYFSFVLVCIFGVVQDSSACNVPVFRYALERWVPDSYGVFIFTRGELDADAKKVAVWLEEQTTGEKAAANYFFSVIDLDSEKCEEWERELWKSWDGSGKKETVLPAMLVFYPRTTRIVVPLMHGPVDLKAAEKAVDSPLRRDMAKRILDGESAVWLLLKTGDEKKDKAARSVLDKGLKKAAEEIELPPYYNPQAADMPGGLPYSEVPVEEEASDDASQGESELEDGGETEPEQKKPMIRFSVLELSRDNKAEQFLVNMLLKSEPDLASVKEPVAFPVFGRGRVLYAFVGKGINENNIMEACFFLIGACSCQVKAMNPGFDMLIYAGWDYMLYQEMVQEPVIPALPGVPEVEEDVPVAEAAEPNAADSAGEAAVAAAPGEEEDGGTEEDTTEAEAQQTASEEPPREVASVSEAPPVNENPDTLPFARPEKKREATAEKTAVNEDKRKEEEAAASFPAPFLYSLIIGGIVLFVLIAGTFILIMKNR